MLFYSSEDEIKLILNTILHIEYKIPNIAYRIQNSQALFIDKKVNLVNKILSGSIYVCLNMY